MKNQTTSQHMEILRTKDVHDHIDAICDFAQNERKLCKGHAAFIFEYMGIELKKQLGITHFQVVEPGKFGEA